ncbi:hypothetical protein D3C78_1438360 [compost metagenome]
MFASIISVSTFLPLKSYIFTDFIFDTESIFKISETGLGYIFRLASLLAKSFTDKEAATFTV